MATERPCKQATPHEAHDYCPGPRSIHQYAHCPGIRALISRDANHRETSS